MFNSRQMGKSSLRVQVMQRLLAEGMACGVVEVSSIVGAGMSAEQWYLGLIRRVSRSLGLRVKVLPWWREREGLSPIQRFSEFVEDVLLKEIAQPIVVFIDEIDSLFQFAFNDDFFALIRSFYQERSEHEAYRRLSFVLLGVATPGDLIRDKRRTSFNIGGRLIDLKGFAPGEVGPLAVGLAQKAENPTAVLGEILHWTQGQPFLTQRLCRLIAESNFSISAGSEQALVTQLVSSRVIEDWEAQDVSVHLKTIRDRLLVRKDHVGRLLGLYRQILQLGQVRVDDSEEQIELRLTGLIREEHNYLRVANLIYQAVFDTQWIEARLLNLRPYGAAIAAWLATAQKSTAFLLRGKLLREAQVWAEDKDLSTQDYQFLSASQDFEQQQLEQTLALEKQEREILADANQVLASAKQKADHDLDKAARRLAISAALVAITLPFAIAVVTWTIRDTQIRDQATVARAIAAQSLSTFQQEGKFLPRSILLAIQAAKQFPKGRSDSLGDIDPVLRNFTLIPPKIRDFNHQSAVLEANFSLDGKWIATADADGKAVIWNLEKDQAAFVIKHDGAVVDVRFSPDSSLVATASDDKTVQVWNVDTGQKESEFSHEKGLKSLDFSPDGKYLSTASRDSKARIWEIQTKEKVAELPHGETVIRANFSPDSQKVVTASADQTVRVWDVRTGQQLQQFDNQEPRDWGDYTLELLSLPTADRLPKTGQKLIVVANIGERYHVRVFDQTGSQIVNKDVNEFLPTEDLTAQLEASLKLLELDTKTVRELIEKIAFNLGHTFWDAQFSPDGKQIATASSGGLAQIWDVENGDLIRDFFHSSIVWDVQFSPDSKYLATSSSDGQARIWSLANNQLVQSLPHESSVWDVRWSKDGRQVVSTSADNTARLWEVSTGEELLRMIHDDEVVDARFSPNDKWLLTNSLDGTAKLWNKDVRDEVVLPISPYPLYRVRFNRDGTLLATSGRSTQVEVWNVETQENVHSFSHDDIVGEIELSPLGHYLAAASDDEIVRVWETEKGQEILRVRHKGKVPNLSFSQDDAFLVSASYDGTAQVWDVAQKTEIRRVSHSKPVRDARLSPDGKVLATASEDKTACLWSVESGEKIDCIVHDDTVLDVRFSPDGRILATASVDGKGRLWNISEPKESVRHLPHSDIVWDIRFSLDSRLVATGSEDRTAKLWDANTGDFMAALYHDTRVDELHFLPNGSQMATISSDGIARVWNTHDGTQTARIQYPGRVRDLRFSPDARTLAVVSDNGVARIMNWRPATNQLIEEACKRLTINLTMAEWAQYIGNKVSYQRTCAELPLPPDTSAQE